MSGETTAPAVNPNEPLPLLWLDTELPNPIPEPSTTVKAAQPDLMSSDGIMDTEITTAIVVDVLNSNSATEPIPNTTVEPVPIDSQPDGAMTSPENATTTAIVVEESDVLDSTPTKEPGSGSSQSQGVECTDVSVELSQPFNSPQKKDASVGDTQSKICEPVDVGVGTSPIHFVDASSGWSQPTLFVDACTGESQEFVKEFRDIATGNSQPLQFCDASVGTSPSKSQESSSSSLEKAEPFNAIEQQECDTVQHQSVDEMNLEDVLLAPAAAGSGPTGRKRRRNSSKIKENYENKLEGSSVECENEGDKENLEDESQFIAPPPSKYRSKLGGIQVSTSPYTLQRTHAAIKIQPHQGFRIGLSKSTTKTIPPLHQRVKRSNDADNDDMDNK